MKHWIERIADELKERDVDEHVVASGTSISGSIHIGNSCDVFIASSIAKTLQHDGFRSRTVWVADDHDPLRKVPYPLPEDYEKYLGMPYSMIPCPDDCCEGFVEHFQRPFLEALERFNISVEHYSGARMYMDGLYNDYIRTSLERAHEIREIFNRYRERPLKEDWLPYNPICEKCGRVNTTEAYDFSGDTVHYRCSCGFQGEMDIKSGRGKLTWRVEWAARWKILGVTCEPFGKDHAASGGSYDVSSVISEEIFGYPAPYPVPYEWITLRGEAMSKSRGVFFTPSQWLEIAPPESLNYFIFRSKPMKHKDFNPEMPFLDLMDQFDRAERIYYGLEEAASEKEEKKLKIIYRVSMIEESDLPLRPSYKFMTVACQIADSDLKRLYDILRRNSQLPGEFMDMEPGDLSEGQVRQLKERIENVKNWLELYAPEFLKFEVQKELPDVQLSDAQRSFLSELADILEDWEMGPEELHDRMYDLLREHGLKPQKAFQAIYRVLIGKKMGPRAASFLLSLQRDFVVRRLRLEA